MVWYFLPDDEVSCHHNFKECQRGISWKAQKGWDSALINEKIIIPKITLLII